MDFRRVTTGVYFALAISLPVARATGQESADRLSQIKTVYVRPIDPDSTDAVLEARKTLAESGCFKVADRQEAADAILEISSDRDGNWIRYPFGRQRVSASAALLDRKTGDALWTNDRSSRWLPSRSYAGRVIARALISDHGCETEDSSWEPFKNLKATPSSGSSSSSSASATPGNTAKAVDKDSSPAAGPAAATSSTHSAEKTEKVIQRGMTYTQVETVLGPPSTRANLGEKTVYKYPDLTVEFRGGKVTDVR
ncbi:MAG TPA: hypothetical protein VG204_09890 [Terriglobia bacterium]|nr:hypothetical protein [Terriglobia bacterium]